MHSAFAQRSYELEHLDKGDYTPEEYEGCIVELQRVNRWLGDVHSLRQSVLKEVERSGVRNFSLLDLGAGSGELLRAVARWAGSRGRSAQLTGLELNARSTRAIREQSADFSNVLAVRGDAFQLPFRDGQFDYVISSLFTHHFTDSQIVVLLREMTRVAVRRIFVIDLHRHPIAYYFYTTIGHLILHNRVCREDGALSILRSFKRRELLRLAQWAGLTDARVKRHFPYRLVLEASPSAQ